ncbi:hypothetical protein JCM15519_09470 [Fundidesulfovibrio butyratiphilus]
MWRSILVAALTVALFAVSAQARLIKEMEVTRTGKLTSSGEQSGGGYTLVLDNNKTIALGDKESFGPATRQVLDQAAAQKLSVEITGHLLIFNDQSPVFALPLKKIDVKGFKPQDQASPAQKEQAAAPAEKGDPGPFKEAFLKGSKRINLGLALEGYAYFISKTWKVTEPGKTAEFRGEINIDDYSSRDSKYFSRLKSKDMRDIFRSLTFVANLNLTGNGQATSSDPYVEAVYLDGAKDKLIWKDPPNYYWDRIAANRKIKIDYFLNKAAQNPKYGKEASN